MLRIYSCTIVLVLLIFESKFVVYRCLSVYYVPCMFFYAAICEINDNDDNDIDVKQDRLTSSGMDRVGRNRFGVWPRPWPRPARWLWRQWRWCCASDIHGIETQVDWKALFDDSRWPRSTWRSFASLPAAHSLLRRPVPLMSGRLEKVTVGLRGKWSRDPTDMKVVWSSSKHRPMLLAAERMRLIRPPTKGPPTSERLRRPPVEKCCCSAMESLDATAARLEQGRWRSPQIAVIRSAASSIPPAPDSDPLPHELRTALVSPTLLCPFPTMLIPRGLCGLQGRRSPRVGFWTDAGWDLG